MSSKHIIGIDVSKNSLDAACLLMDTSTQQTRPCGARKFDNGPSGFKTLEKWGRERLGKHAHIHYVMESTGNYHEQLALSLLGKHATVHVVLANRAKAFMASVGQKTKNDRKDAQGLALMGAVQALDEWKPIQKKYFRLRAMTRHYEDLQKIRTSLLNQKHALSNGMYPVPDVEKSMDKVIGDVEKQVAKLKKNIEAFLLNDNDLKDRAECAASIPSVGLLTVAVIVAETNGFVLVKNLKQLVSYAGYDVRENQSGSKKGKTSISKKGNAHIRRAMFCPACSAFGPNGAKVFSQLRERVLERTGMPMKANVAVQSKLLRFIYTLWTKQQKFDHHFDADKKADTEKEGNTGQQEVAAPPSPDRPQAKNQQEIAMSNKQKTVAPSGTTALDDAPSEQSVEHLLLQ